MIKTVQIKLISIQYSGENIGDDIRIKIEGSEINFNDKKQIKSGTIAKWDKVIGNIVTDQPQFTIPLTITIIEEDAVFNDVGSSKIDLKIDLQKIGPQVSTYRVKVFETRWTTKKIEAVFDIVLEVRLLENAIRYIKEQSDGFLQVIMGNGKKESLPAYLKVLFHYSESDRDYFTVQEGVLQGKKGSVKHDKDGSSFLQSGNPHSSPVHMAYSISSGKLTIKDKNYSVVVDPSNSWKIGLYDIEIPDHIHELGKRYIDKAPKAMVWFHIGHNYKDERYIHTGTITEGCMTLNEVERWDEVYSILIRARKGDFKSIGVLEVIN